MRTARLCCAMLLIATGGGVYAQDFLRDPAEVQALLSGTTLSGVYLRSNSPYTLEFRPDGTLVDAHGASARWWVDEDGRYCREWTSGRLAGNRACMDLVLEGNRIHMYSSGNRVAEGELSRSP
jgi:hypothetical protein